MVPVCKVTPQLWTFAPEDLLQMTNSPSNPEANPDVIKNQFRRDFCSFMCV